LLLQTDYSNCEKNSMRLPGGFADEVKSQADIVRIVSDYVSLKKRGANYIARCPFHSEKTPSFNVHQAKGIFKCFGCQAGGSVYDFIMQIEGCSFPEAVRIVATKSGIPIPEFSGGEDQKKAARDRESVLKLNEWAVDFFAEHFYSAGPGERARAYIKDRGILEETCKRFRIGYAPDSWDALTNHLRKRGAATEEIEKSGLVVLKDDGKFYDRFRGRVMFPIADSQDRVIAFGGRVMDAGEPKYLNSPETAAYTKGRNLYGLGLARNDIRRQGVAVLVEGYLDCIIPMQAGIGNVVASLGTALTDGQVRLLRRYMERPQVIVNFDPDAAGQSAAMRSIDLFLAEGFRVSVLTMPTKEDPDEFVRSHGSEAFKSLLAAAEPYIEFVIETATRVHDTKRPAGKVEAINSILPHLIRMPDKVARANYAEQIADRLRVDSRLIREELKRAATDKRQSLDSKRIRSVDDVTDAERQLLELILMRTDVRAAVLPNLDEEDYAELATSFLFKRVVEIDRVGEILNYEALSIGVEGEFEKSLVAGLFISDLAWAKGDDFETLFKHATEAILSLRIRLLERKREAIQIQLSEAEGANNQDLVIRLYQEKAELKRRMLRMTQLTESVAKGAGKPQL
jgi:DNA primase